MHYFNEKQKRKQAKLARLRVSAINACGVGYGGNPEPYILPNRYAKRFMNN